MNDSQQKTSENVAIFLEKHFKNVEITEVKPLLSETEKIRRGSGTWLVSFGNDFTIKLKFDTYGKETPTVPDACREIIVVFESLIENTSESETTLYGVYFRRGSIMDFVNKIFDEIDEYVKVVQSHERRVQLKEDVLCCDWYERHLSNFAEIDGFMQGVSSCSKHMVRDSFIKSLLSNNEIARASRDENATDIHGDWTLTLENGLTLDITILSNDIYALMEENKIVEFYKISKGTDSVQMHGHRFYLDKPENGVLYEITDKIKKAIAEASEKTESSSDALATLENFVERKR